MSQLVVYENAGRYSAASIAGVQFYNLSYEAAAVALMDAGFSIGLLESPVDGLTWRSTLTSAFANEIQALNEQVAGLAPSFDVDELRDKQADLEAGMVLLNRQLRAEGIRTEIARCEAEMDRQLPLTMQLMGPRAKEWEARLIVSGGPWGKRLEALHAEWRQLL
jgi:hypothetical protein